MCTLGGDLCRHELSLQRRREPLRLVQPQPEIGHTGLHVALNAGELGLGDHAWLKFRDQLHLPHQLATSSPSSREPAPYPDRLSPPPVCVLSTAARPQSDFCTKATL